MSSMNNQKISTTLPKVEYIAHISDVHIRLYQYHDRYRIVFSKLYNALKKMKHEVSNLMVIAITGDLLHSKNQLSPECTNITIDFLENLAKIAPTFLIAGNHDALLENSSRLDSISSILYKRDIPNLYYLQKSGIYEFANIHFYVDSLLDHEENVYQGTFQEPSDSTVKDEKGFYKVALYHGQIAGWVNNIGYQSKTGEKYKDEFKYMDYTLLGDIHKYQFMTPTMAYPGSLISQNCGESDDFHGFLQWNIETGTTNYVKINNEYRFVDILFRESETFIKDTKEYTLDKLPIEKYANCRILTTHNDVKNKLILNELKSQHPDAKFRIQKANKQGIENEKNTDSILQNFVEDEKNSAIEYVNKKIKDKAIAKRIISELLNDWQEICTKQNNVEWELIRIEFSNMFAYGENNVFSFSNENNVYGIFGENASGKSSFADIITYLLTGKITRYSHGNTVPKEIINHQQNKANGSVLFKVGSDAYIIEKFFTRGANSKIKVVQKFYKIGNCMDLYSIPLKEILKNEQCTELTGEQRKRTDDEIEKVIGNFPYFTYINFLFQQGEESFRNFTPAKKKKFLIELFGYGWIEELEKKKKEKLKQLQITSKTFENKIGSQSESSFSSSLKEYQSQIENTHESITEISKDIEEKHLSIKGHLEALYYPMKNLSDNNFISQFGVSEKNKTNVLKQQKKEIKMDLQELERDVSLLEKSCHQKEKLEMLDKNDEFYTSLSPFFQESISPWNRQKKTMETFSDFNVKEAEDKIQILEEKIQTVSKNANFGTSGPILKSYESVEEINSVLETKRKNEIKVEKKITQLVSQKVNISSEWKENLLMYHERSKLYLLARHDYESQAKHLKNCSSIRYNKACSACQENPYYLNKVKIETEYREAKKKMIVAEKEEQKSKEFFYEMTMKHLSSKEVQEIQDRQMEIQNDIIKWQREQKKIGENIIKLENTKIYLEGKEASSRIARCQNELNMLKKAKNNYIMYLEKKPVCEILAIEWNKLGSFTKKERLQFLKNENESTRLLEDKKTVIDQKKEDNIRLEVEIKELEKTLLLEKEKLDRDMERFHKIQEIEQSLIKTNKRKENFQKEETELTTKIIQTETTFELWKKDAQEWKQLVEELEYTQQLCSLFDKDEFPCFLLRSKFPLLEQQINEIIQLFLNGKVTFRLDEKIVDVGVETLQGTSSFLSGMESFIVDLAIKLSFAKFSVMPRSNFFLIDEHVSVLDKERLSSVNDLLDLLSNITKNVLLISHLPQINDFVSKPVYVLKSEKGSKIQT